MTVRLGLDVGGTFTDLVLQDASGRLSATKVPTTHDDLVRGLLDGLRTLAGTAGESERSLLTRVDAIVHGTTVATNAVLTETGAHTGLITTKGFRDILAMRRGLREAFYDNKYVAPAPLVPRYLRRTVTERITASGEILTALSLDDVRDACQVLLREKVEAVAIAFMHSYKNPSHEQQAAALVRELMPNVFVTASHEILPAIRLYDRTSTTVFNAYTGPIVHRYLSRLEGALRERGFRGSLLIMQSNGGITSPAEAARAPARLILSGPAGGPAAGVAAADSLGLRDLVVCDAGGTSFEVSLIQDGKPLLLREQDVDRRRIALPALGIHTIGAGGGSIGWVDSGGLLHVGPQSAGSMPGPACYSRGGTEATATDAAVILGYLDPDSFLDGRMKIDRAGAEAAVGRIGEKLGLDIVAAARGMVEIVAANMAAGIQTVTVKRGHDPREFLLIAGGGAGPLFACRIAEELQIPALLVPAMSATLCAAGALYADLAHDQMMPLSGRIDTLQSSLWRDGLETMRRHGDGLLEREGVAAGRREFLAAADIRYFGQYDDITIPLTPEEWSGASLDSILPRFHATHDALNGYASPEQPCEVTALHMTSRGIVDRPPTAEVERTAKVATRPIRRRIWLESGAVDVPVYIMTRMARGEIIEGPAIVELPGSTLLLRPAFSAGIDSGGNLLAFVTQRRDFAELLAR
jgi:N-methylhydantoinase A